MDPQVKPEGDGWFAMVDMKLVFLEQNCESYLQHQMMKFLDLEGNLWIYSTILLKVIQS